MAAELCGAKLLAPVFGSSLYVWSAVMGVTLGALATGYFYGGKLSLKKENLNSVLFKVLLLAAIFILLMPLCESYLLNYLSSFPFTLAVVLSSFVILFLPVFLLGASSPLFIALQTKTQNDSGQVSGTIYAISTFGGIIATFLCGFYLIPQWGLTITLINFGSLLFIAALLLLKIFKVAYLFIFFGLFFLNLKHFYTAEDILYSSESIMGKVEIKDVKRAEGNVRLLLVNKIVQSEMSLLTQKSVSDYIKLLDAVIINEKAPKRALVLGLGAGLTSNLLVQKGYHVTAVEFDARIIEVAENYFELNKKVRTVCDDARHFINQSDERYDLVLFDVFKSEELPDHVITQESLAKLKHLLYPNAQVFVNWHGYLKGEIGKGTSVVYNTLKTSFSEVFLNSTSLVEDSRNIVFTAFNPQSLYSNSYVDTNFVPFLFPTQEINTDDRPVLQKANALAGKRWRALYLLASI